ncbi:hypothetical protein [Microbispora sp. NPDC049125]|uniref:hypothetical protein n=1 Tax=Microbispora sp. NPDC049125 TaxID=3154929 RepID=UPI0034655FC1
MYQVISIKINGERVAIGHAHSTEMANRVAMHLRMDAEPRIDPCDCATPNGNCATMNAAYARLCLPQRT